MLRHEVVVIGGHYDGQGRTGEVNMGRRAPPDWVRHVAMINLEMIGWEPTLPANVRATGTSPEWPELVREVSEETGVLVNMPMPGLTNDTDHYGFGVRGVPAVHYGVPGIREHYHAVSDVADHISVEALAHPDPAHPGDHARACRPGPGTQPRLGSPTRCRGQRVCEDARQMIAAPTATPMKNRRQLNG